MVRMVCSFKDGGNKAVHFHPVYSGPGVTVSLNVLNDAAFAQFEQGKEYYVDFTPAAQPESAGVQVSTSGRKMRKRKVGK